MSNPRHPYYTIIIILYGHRLCVVSFKGQKIWHYFTGDIVKPVDNEDEPDEKFADCLEE